MISYDIFTLVLFAKQMGGRDLCIVPGCPNARHRPDKQIKMDHVDTLRFFGPRLDELEIWQKAIDCGDVKMSKHSRVCSNHFTHGEPCSIDRIPTLYLRVTQKNYKILYDLYITLFKFIKNVCYTVITFENTYVFTESISDIENLHFC